MASPSDKRPVIRAGFWVVDLTGTGEVRLKQEYDYSSLEQLEGASELIGLFSAELWRSPEGFDAQLGGADLTMRWRACAESAGLATLRQGEGLISLSVLLSGQEADADAATLKSLQLHLVRELHDTGYEPAFDLVYLRERPLVASMNFRAPETAKGRGLFALADRCFAASYFRKLGLA
jgi:hypothetical protein